MSTMTSSHDMHDWSIAADRALLFAQCETCHDANKEEPAMETKHMHKIHDRLPSGFSYANDLQAAEYAESGSINGASKVAFVSAQNLSRTTLVAVRLRPPRTYLDINGRLPRAEIVKRGLCATEARDWYIREYNNGWQSGHSAGHSAAWGSGATTSAWDDGFLDARSDRAKWHLTYCADHDACGEG